MGVVFSESRAEFLAEERFFALALKWNVAEKIQEAEQAAELALDHARAEQAQEEPV